jgi:hypothetical protein
LTAKEYQVALLPKLIAKFPTQEIRNEWTTFNGVRHQYSPRVDIAIGPFNTIPGSNSIDEYNGLLQDNNINHFLRQAFLMHVENLDTDLYQEIIHPVFDDLIYKNQNSRCFMALEIENQNSKKHIMGSVVNAASLGRIGVGIAFSNSTLRTFCRILNYLSFLKRVDKNTYDTTNFLILTVSQLEQLIRL